jgi:hypothetical protein
MNRKLAVIIVSLLILICAAPTAISAEISVGVKEGDWIEYQVNFTGNPPESHDVTWARMEIVSVQGPSINLNVTTEFSNETLLNEMVALNLETGQLGDDFIIPANLNSGSTFFDKRTGNITIAGVEEKSSAGVTRTVVYASTAETTFYWDRATGILVAANSSFTDEFNYTMNTKTEKTNMWQPQLLGLDPTVFYAIVIAAVAISVIIAFLVIRRKK